MKKIIFTLLALVGTMSMNAQVLKIYNGDQIVAAFTADQADRYVFEKLPDPVEGSVGTAPRYDETVIGGEVDVKWVQLWEDGPKFAEYNIGATSATEYGCYYCWGGVVDRDPDAEWNYWQGDELGDYDTATRLWGDNWRMPTKDDFQALIYNCTCIWKENYNGTGVNGTLCTGKGDYISNSIFLPAGGFYDDQGKIGGDLNREAPGKDGFYWTSTPSGSLSACYMYIHKVYVSGRGRSNSLSIRAVLKEEDE